MVNLMNTRDPGLRVMVVDDVAAHRRLLTEVLVALEVNCVKAACDGSEAAAAAAVADYDLIFMDVSMPVMDGLTAVKQIRTDERSRSRQPSAIFMHSSQTEPTDHWASRLAGADGHIDKPVRVADIVEALHYAARRSRTSMGARTAAPCSAPERRVAA